MFDTNNPALIIVDVQKAIDNFSDNERNNREAEERISELLSRWRTKSLPIFHVRHSSKYKNSPYHVSNQFDFKDQVAPREGEIIITKSENCAFIGTNMEEDLKHTNISELVICGVLTNNSIDATVRVASGLGFSVKLVSDATAAFGISALNNKYYSAEDVHWLFLSNLDGEYCSVVSTEEVLNQSL